MKVETGKARKPWPCNFTDCRKKIKKGEGYLLWHLKGEALRQHTEHGQPKLSPTAKKTTKAAPKKKVTKKKATKKGGKQ